MNSLKRFKTTIKLNKKIKSFNKSVTNFNLKDLVE